MGWPWNYLQFNFLSCYNNLDRKGGRELQSLTTWIWTTHVLHSAYETAKADRGAPSKLIVTRGSVTFWETVAEQVMFSWDNLKSL